MSSILIRRLPQAAALRFSIRSVSSSSPFIRKTQRTRTFQRGGYSDICGRYTFSTHQRLQSAASRSSNEIVEELEELYEAARDEFQIAAEETEENTIYAADDRIAAREHVDKLRTTYDNIIENHNYTQDVRENVKKRAGQRVRELTNAMTALEEKAQQQD